MNQTVVRNLHLTSNQIPGNPINFRKAMERARDSGMDETN